MTKFSAFSQGLGAGANLGTQLINLKMNVERQDWNRYQHEKGVEGDKLNALMNVATSQYGGDVTQMAKSPSGLQMMFDFVKDDPQVKQQLESNKGWTPAGMYRDDATGTYGIVVSNEDGERKPLTVDRAAGSASFQLTEDDLLRTFAAAAGRTGQKDTLTMNRMLNIVNNMDGVDQEEAKAILSGGSGGVDIPTAPSIQNVSKAARDNRESNDPYQIASSTTNAPEKDPESGAESSETLYIPDTSEVPALGAPAIAPTREDTPEDEEAAELAEADLAEIESQRSGDAVVATVQQAVENGIATEEEGNDLINQWSSGDLSANGIEGKLRQLLDRTQVLGQEAAPKDRTQALNRLVTGQATNDDLTVEERGVAPAYGGQDFTTANVAPDPKRDMLESALGIKQMYDSQPQREEAPVLGTPAVDGLRRAATAIGGASVLSNAPEALSTIVDSAPEGAIDAVKDVPRVAGEMYDAMQKGDYKSVAKLFGSESREAAGLASEFASNVATSVSEGWDAAVGVAADAFSSFSEGYSGKKAQAAENIIDDKLTRTAQQTDAPEKAKTEASRQRISTSTSNDPEKLANTTQVIKAQTESLRPGERVIKDRELMDRAFTPAKKPSAKQKYAATYLLTSGMISEPAYRHYMTTGEWSNADRALAQSELAFRHQYVKDRISLAKLTTKVGKENVEEMKSSFDQASKRSSPIVASAVFNSPSLAQGQEMSQEQANKYSSLLLDSYLDNPLLLAREGVSSKYELSPERVNFVAENIATEISNGTLIFQKPSKAEDSSLFSSRYWFGDDKQGINPLSQRDIAAKVQGWYKKEEQ